jgi:hypothetical protein
MNTIRTGYLYRLFILQVHDFRADGKVTKMELVDIVSAWLRE